MLSYETADRPSATAEAFDLKHLPGTTDDLRVVWYDRDTNGALVLYYDSVGKHATRRAAEERKRKLVAIRDQQRPHVKLCPNRDLYMLHVYVGDPPKLLRRSLGTRDPDEVPRRMEQRLAELGLGTAVAQFTVQQLLSEYFDQKLGTASYATRASYRSIIGKLRDALTDDKPVRHVTDADLTAYREQRLRSISHNSFRLDAVVWNAAVRHAVKTKRIKQTDAPPLIDVAKPVVHDKLVLTKDDWATVLDYAEAWRTSGGYYGDRNRLSSLELYLWLVRYTGARVGALMDLTWDRVDMSHDVIHLQPSGIRETSKRRPSVPIAPDLRPILERAAAEREPTDANVLWQREHIGSKLRRLRAKMQDDPDPRVQDMAERLHSHAFRRSYITWAVAAGLSPYLIGQVTGQSTQIIETVYAAYRPDMGRSVVDAV